MGNLAQWPEPAQTLKVRDGNGHLRLVVVVGIILGVPGVQLLGELLVGVGLDGEGLVDGEHLEEKGQLGAIFGLDRGR